MGISIGSISKSERLLLCWAIAYLLAAPLNESLFLLNTGWRLLIALPLLLVSLEVVFRRSKRASVLVFSVLIAVLEIGNSYFMNFWIENQVNSEFTQLFGADDGINAGSDLWFFFDVSINVLMVGTVVYIYRSRVASIGK